jgi:hypothetical protein
VPSGAGAFSGAECPTSASRVTVGTAGEFASAPLIERWTGTAGIVDAPALPAGDA